MQLPLIHLNGSGRENLVRDYRAAWEAVNAAVEAVQAICPHSRDYYPLGDAAYRTARDEHQDRVNRLSVIRQELELMTLAIMQEGE